MGEGRYRRHSPAGNGQGGGKVACHGIKPLHETQRRAFPQINKKGFGAGGVDEAEALSLPGGRIAAKIGRAGDGDVHRRQEGVDMPHLPGGGAVQGRPPVKGIGRIGPVMKTPDALMAVGMPRTAGDQILIDPAANIQRGEAIAPLGLKIQGKILIKTNPLSY